MTISQWEPGWTACAQQGCQIVMLKDSDNVRDRARPYCMTHRLERAGTKPRSAELVGAA